MLSPAIAGGDQTADSPEKAVMSAQGTREGVG